MPKFSQPAGVDHDSTYPHGKTVKGAKFKARSFFRPTGMSVPLAAAGVIPDVHLVRDLSCTGLLRHKRDNRNIRPSTRVAF